MTRDHRAGSTLLQRLLDGPVFEALMERAADAILTWGKKPPSERPDEIVIDADFEDLPAKAPGALTGRAGATKPRRKGKGAQGPPEAP